MKKFVIFFFTLILFYGNQQSFAQADIKIVDADWPLTYKVDNNSAWISGQINNTNPIDFKETILQYSRIPFDSTNETSEILPAGAMYESARWEESANATLGVSPDGKYGFKLENLSPNAVYYVKQIIKSTDRDIKEIKIDKFNSTKGYVVEGSVDAVSDYNKRSYTLLAELPGLKVVFDQDLCREYVAEGKPVPGGDCDNQLANFINLLIKILIGLAAIVLVVQLIIQGYVYMVTDVPFLRAGAKSRFFDALFGLLLAMASYLILNTINPRLVSGTLNVSGVDVGVEERLAVSFSKYTEGTGGPLSPDDIKKMKAQYGKAWDAVRTTYIPARDKAVPTASKGAKILMTAQTTVEGFYPNTKSWRTNNPGNVGNTDSGATTSFPTLDAGIKRQYEHLTRIINDQNPAYKIGRVVNQGPVTDVATGITYPGISFNFDGSLHQYLKIYATGARKDNNYLSFVIAFFEKEGIKITGYTKISEIYNMK